jgi:hypothetical protein
VTNADPDIQAELLRLLPDTPRWVETRGMLLRRDYQIFGDSTNTVVTHPAMQVVTVLGAPSQDLVMRTLAVAVHPAQILTAPENTANVRNLFPEWQLEMALLHLLSASLNIPCADVKLLETYDDSIPAALLLELERVPSPVAAKFVDGKPVAFCYASSETETLWDVSIDTLEGHRRKGYAIECVAYMIELMAKKRKQPVWGAMNSNAASLTLAKKLGFKPVDQLAVFSKFNVEKSVDT